MVIKRVQVKECTLMEANRILAKLPAEDFVDLKEKMNSCGYLLIYKTNNYTKPERKVEIG